MYTGVGMPDIVLNVVCCVCASHIFHAPFGLNLIEWFFLGIFNFDSITILDGRMLNTVHSDRRKNVIMWNKGEEKWNVLLWMCTNVITKKKKLFEWRRWRRHFYLAKFVHILYATMTAWQAIKWQHSMWWCAVYKNGLRQPASKSTTVW